MLRVLHCRQLNISTREKKVQCKLITVIKIKTVGNNNKKDCMATTQLSLAQHITNQPISGVFGQLNCNIFDTGT